MDLFDELDLLDSPATDSATNERVPAGERCPDCGVPAYGPCGALNATSWRTDAGHLTVSHCDCGRYLWYERQEREWAAPAGLADWETLVTLPDGSKRIEPLGYHYVPDPPPRPTKRWVPGAGFAYRAKPDGDDGPIRRWQARLAWDRRRTEERDREAPSSESVADPVLDARRAERTCPVSGPHPAGP